jgi:FKBP-type peptidyl-prolyl cis-trans isomerase SlyD
MLPANIFHDENGAFDKEMFQVGSMVPMSDSEGNQLRGRILEVAEETVQMDFNHPLADTDLHFVGTILEVRDAEAEELAHGHAHGPHGHQH